MVGRPRSRYLSVSHLGPLLTKSLLLPVNIVGLLLLVCIGILRYLSGNTDVAVLLFLVSALVLSITVFAVISGHTRFPERASSLVYSVAIVMLSYEIFEIAGYWLLVILTLNFYLVSVRMALVMNVLIIIAAMPVILTRFVELTDVLSYMVATLTATILGVLHFVRTQHYTRELEKWSFQDPLTHLFTRRRLDEDFEAAHASKVRYDEPATILIIDIDHFKEINDRFGHESGDRILVKLAHILNRELRMGSETVYRIGGEEFVVLLHKTTLEQAIGIAERLRKKVQDEIIFNNEGITISVGCTELERTDSWKSCFARGDRALYQAKQNGRNRVELMA